MPLNGRGPATQKIFARRGKIKAIGRTGRLPKWERASVIRAQAVAAA
jgi:hypothetical protein